MIKALIIDDEKHCIDNLQWQLNKYCPEVEVAAVCMNAENGLNEIYSQQQQLVFLDVKGLENTLFLSRKNIIKVIQSI